MTLKVSVPGPEGSFRFIHLDGFTGDWKKLRLYDDDLRSLQNQIMPSPQAAPVVAGTGGIRKTRFAPPSWSRGKSGAIRVLYAVFPEHSVVVLAAAFAKNEMENIQSGEKKLLKLILMQIKAALEQGH